MSKQASEFQEKVMSRFFRGKEIFKPLNTGRIDERVRCIREFVANIFFYKKLLKDGQIFTIEDIQIEFFLAPGHTWGHMVYLIDDEYLFTGDTIWFGVDGGRSFINMLAEDNRLAICSLAMLEEKLRARGLRPKIITGHTGWTDDLDFAFAHRDKVCNAYAKQKPHDKHAPYDAYNESDDTEEKARSVRLKKQNER